MAATMQTCRAPCFRPVTAARPARSLVISASYKNKENIDLTRSDAYRKNAKDCGSAEFQVALLSARVEQVSKHLTANRKDFAAKRGLIAILSQRKSLLQYLFKENRDAYDRLCKDFNIRGVVASDTRGAARKEEAAASA